MKAIRLVSRISPVIIILMMTLPCALAQGKPPGGGGAGNSKGDNSKPPVTQQPPATQNQKMQRQDLQTVYITGMVVQEDGSPLPTGAVIERVCGGRVKKEAYVSASGSFGFQVGGINATSDVLPDASDDDTFGGGFGSFGGQPSPSGFGSAGSNMMSPSNLMGCELHVQLAGYRSSTIILDGFTPMGNLDVGTILVQPISKSPGTTVSLTDMQAPKSAKRSLEHANKALQKKNLPEAEKELKLAIDAYPNYATALYKLGMVYQLQNRIPDAREAFTKAIAADGRFVNPYIQLARLAGMEKKWPEVAEITDKAMALDSLDFPEGYYYNSLANLFMQKLDLAERSARKAQRLDPLHRLPRTNLLLAEILERKHDISGSIEQLQAYLKFTPAPPDADEARQRLQKLEESSKTMAGNP